MSNMKTLAPSNQKSLIRLRFLSWSNSKVKGQKIKVLVSNEMSHIRNIQMKYESPTTYQSKVTTKDKVGQRSEGQGHGTK
jgi:hypothetical protein